MADVTVTLGARDAGLQAAMNRAQGAANNFKAALSNMAAPLAALGGVTAAFAGIGTAISKAAEVEGLQTAFIPLLGSADEAKARIEELSRFAASTPFELTEIAKASKVLETLTRGALSTGEGLTLVGDVASATNVPFSEISATIGRLYDGLQSGRPVGEAMARLQELGAISGETRARLEELSASGANQEAWQTAEQALGRFSGSMQLQSGTWNGLLSTLSDNISMALAQFGEPILQTLKPTLQDLIGAAENFAKNAAQLGQTFATITSAAISLASTLSNMIPAIIGVTVAFAAFRSGLDAKVIASVSRIGPVSAAAFAQMRISMASVNFASFGAAGRAAFVSIGVAARGAALAIKGALISTGIGAIIAGIAFAIEALMGRLAAASQAIENLNTSMQDSVSAARALYEEIDKISTEAEKVSFGKRLEEEIEKSRKKIAELQNDTSLGDEDRTMGIAGLESQIASLERLRAAAENITPEVLAGRQAERDRAAALAESERQAASLNAELGKGKTALDKKIADSAFNELGAQDQKDTTLSGVGLGSTASVDAELAALAAKREATFLTGEEAKRMEALLEARSKLVDIEKSINDERDRAAEQAARDQERADAEARVAAEKAAANAELQKTLQLELAIAEARASKNTQEEGKLQFVKDYQAALERARQAGIEGNEAFDFANRSANAEATQRNQGPQSEQASNEPLFSSSLAKIGGGGGIAGAPGLLDENKKQTNILQSLADVSKSVLPEISNRLAGIFSDKPAEPAARKEGPSPTLQSPEVPSLKAPTLQSPEVPSLKAPTLQSPEVPSLKAPRLQAPQIPPMEPLPIIPPPAIEPTKAIGGFDLQSRLDQSNVKGAFEKDKISSALYQEARLQTNFLRQIAQRLGNLNPTPLLA